jgi:hypothetical protein
MLNSCWKFNVASPHSVPQAAQSSHAKPAQPFQDWRI